MEPAGTLTVDGLNTFRTGRWILGNIAFEFRGPGVTAILGPGGAGKSTLLHALAGTLEGSAETRVTGLRLLGGRPIDPTRVRFVQQRVPNMMMPLGQLLADALPNRSSLTVAMQRESIDERVRAADAAVLLEHLDEPVALLPLAVRRLAGILSAGWSDACLLLMDEPTAALDDDASEAILRVIQSLGRSRRVLFVTHNQRHARAVADDVLLLASGRLIEHSPAETFFREPQTPEGRQYVRTGGCTVPGLNVLPEDVSEEWQDARWFPTAPVDDAPEPAAPFSERDEEPTQEVAAVPAVATSVVVPAEADERPPLTHGWQSSDWDPVDTCETVRIAESEPGSSADAYSDGTPAPRASTAAAAEWVSEKRGPRDFFWIRPGRLAGTPRPGIVAELDDDLAALARVGVTFLVSLTTQRVAPQALLAWGMRGAHFPIVDMRAPTCEMALQMIRNAEAEMEAGGVVAYHCRAGIGRTGTMLAAQIIWSEGLRADEALRVVRDVNPRYVQSDEQERFLHEFDAWVRAELAPR